MHALPEWREERQGEKLSRRQHRAYPHHHICIHLYMYIFVHTNTHTHALIYIYVDVYTRIYAYPSVYHRTSLSSSFPGGVVPTVLWREGAIFRVQTRARSATIAATGAIRYFRRRAHIGHAARAPARFPSRDLKREMKKSATKKAFDVFCGVFVAVLFFSPLNRLHLDL